jgi:hypothetical protein
MHASSHVRSSLPETRAFAPWRGLAVGVARSLSRRACAQQADAERSERRFLTDRDRGSVNAA